MENSWNNSRSSSYKNFTMSLAIRFIFANISCQYSEKKKNLNSHPEPNILTETRIASQLRVSKYTFFYEYDRRFGDSYSLTRAFKLRECRLSLARRITRSSRIMRITVKGHFRFLK